MWSYHTVDKWIVTWQKVQLVDSPTAKRYLEHFQLVYDFTQETFTFNFRRVLAKKRSFIGWRDNGTFQRYPLTEDFTEFVDTAFLVDGEAEVAPPVVEPIPATPPEQFPTAIPERPVVPSPHHPPFMGFPDPLPTGTPGDPFVPDHGEDISTVLSKEWFALDDKYEYRIQRRLK